MLRFLKTISVLVSFIALSCSGPKTFTRPVEIPDDSNDIPQPASQSINILSDGFEKQFMLPIQQFLDIPLQVRRGFNIPREVVNVDVFDEVVNSTWFTNRNGSGLLETGAIIKGPDTGKGPDISGKWTIFQAKAEGLTPGFSIIDSRGDRYVIKFDPKQYPELVSGAEIVSTKLFYAAGYNVPENYLVQFDPRILRLDDDVNFTDERGRIRSMSEEDIDAILQRVPIFPDGKIKAVASKFIKGVPIGPFKYKGVREDDPNDLIRHQHRRELRGLRVIASWLNHYDTKANNSFDSYVADGNRHYVKHYLIDFSGRRLERSQMDRNPVISDMKIQLIPEN